MENIKTLFKKEKIGEMLLSILFVIYLIMNYKLPASLSNLIDTTYGKVVVIVIAIVLFAYSNPILGVLGFIVAYKLLKSSSISTGTFGLNNYLPSEERKKSELTMYNQFPYTLEQEIVKKMGPIIKTDNSKTPASYKPILEDLHDAAPLNYTGVI